MLTKTARVEIIAALATRMVQYTRYPTPYEYQTVCKKLIQTYPNIQDPVGNGYVSTAVPKMFPLMNVHGGSNIPPHVVYLSIVLISTYSCLFHNDIAGNI